MKISKIKIENFRSIESAEIQPGSFNTFVGRNNHGKSNILEAMEWFYLGKGEISEIKRCGAAVDEDVVVELEFCNAMQGIEHISNDENKKKIRNIIGDNDSFIVRRTSKDPKNRFIYNDQKRAWQKQPTGADSAFNNCIPRFEFILTDKNLKEVSAFKAATPIGQMLGSVFSEALEKDDKYLAFKRTFEELFQSPDSNVRTIMQETSDRVRSHLVMQFPDCASVEFKVEIPPFEEFFKGYSTTVDDGVPTDATDKGDGMQRALMLAIIKAHADSRRSDALGKAFVFFIDEAELHLHPTAQRQLKRALASLSDSVDQVFITTHSSVFMSDAQDGQTEFIVEKEDGVTHVQAMTAAGRMRSVYELLGGNPTDLLLPANFLIVEGPSEVALLELICARHYPEQPRIQIVAAAGDDERQAQYLSAISKLFLPIKDSPIYRRRVVILFDQPTGSDKVTRLANFLSENPDLERDGRSHTLPTLGLEDYYPAVLRQQKAGLTRKIKLAKFIGENIAKQDFESEMPVLHRALLACWRHAYS